jgi:hypothetical protein
MTVIDATDRHLTCPWCGARIGAFSTETPGDQPDPGDVAICAGCLRYNIFQPSATGLVMRRANAAELAWIESQPEYRAARRAVEDFDTPADAERAWRSGYGQEEG